MNLEGVQVRVGGGIIGADPHEGGLLVFLESILCEGCKGGSVEHAWPEPVCLNCGRSDYGKTIEVSL